MAKKGQVFLDNSVIQHSKSKIESAENPTNITAPAKPKSRVYANEALENVDRNKLKNVHMDLETEVKIMEIKTARVRRHIKSTSDSIMYEAIVDWLERNYDKEIKGE